MITLLLPTLVYGAENALTDFTTDDPSVPQGMKKAEWQQQLTKMIALSREDKEWLEILGTTTNIEMKGNVYETEVGFTYSKTIRMFRDSIPYDLKFKFVRLPNGSNPDNQKQYALEFSAIDDYSTHCIVKRNNAAGTEISDAGQKIIITFNERGQFNLCDYGQPTESDVAPNLYIVWDDDRIPPTKFTLDIGRGKGQSPTHWKGTPDPAAQSYFMSNESGPVGMRTRLSNTLNDTTTVNAWKTRITLKIDSPPQFELETWKAEEMLKIEAQFEAWLRLQEVE
jgi:hypothetical protein